MHVDARLQHLWLYKCFYARTERNYSRDDILKGFDECMESPEIPIAQPPQVRHKCMLQFSPTLQLFKVNLSLSSKHTRKSYPFATRS